MINKLLLLLLFPLSLCQCTKKEPPAVLYKGVVLYSVCGNVVIQTSGPDRIGENNWTDKNDPNLPRYDHVFTVANACEFGVYSQGDTIGFVLTKPRAQQCAQCEIYVDKPARAYPIRVIR